eukprot:COSAG02_NODE_26730_length_626_cov_0.736243_1_plen_74_part_00
MWLLARLAVMLVIVPRILADSLGRSDEQQFLNDLDSMSPKELKKFVRANGIPSATSTICAAGHALEHLLDFQV